MNVGTIVEASMLKVRLVRSRNKAQRPHRARSGAADACSARSRNISSRSLAVGDTFVFAGEILRYEAIVEDEVYVSRATDDDPKVPSYEGGKFPLSTYLAARVRKIIADPAHMEGAAGAGARMAGNPEMALAACRGRSELLVETFPRGRNIISSAIRSRGGSRTRRSACC